MLNRPAGLIGIRMGAGALLALLLAALVLVGASKPVAAQQPVGPCERAVVAARTPLDPLMQDAGVRGVLDGISGRVAQVRGRFSVPSISIAIIHDQTPIFEGSFGCAVLDPVTGAAPSTAYRVGSITKLFTDTMLMQMRDAGLVDLDQPVSAYLPEVTYLSPTGERVSPTFRQLAQHRSGLPRTMRPPPATLQELFERLPSTVAMWDPGEEFSYSNLGVALLGQSLARIAGQPYDAYVHQHILAPLGMTHSGFDRTVEGAPWAAAGYRGPNLQPLPFPTQTGLAPAGALWASAQDMLRFAALQFRDGPAVGEQVLSATSLHEMWTSTAPTRGGRVGIGWFVSSRQGETVIMHNGRVEGFRADLKLVPELKLAIIVQYNVDTVSSALPVGPEPLANMILDALIPAVRDATRP